MPCDRVLNDLGAIYTYTSALACGLIHQLSHNCPLPSLRLAIIMLMLWIEIGLPFYFGQLKHSHIKADRDTVLVAAQLKSQNTIDTG